MEGEGTTSLCLPCCSPSGGEGEEQGGGWGRRDRWLRRRESRRPDSQAVKAPGEKGRSGEKSSHGLWREKQDSGLPYHIWKKNYISLSLLSPATAGRPGQALPEKELASPQAAALPLYNSQ